MDDQPNLLTEAATYADGGFSGLARAAGVTARTVRRWEQAERLPLSCLCGFRRYHIGIAAATGGQVTARQLLKWTRDAWRRYYAAGGHD